MENPCLHQILNQAFSEQILAGREAAISQFFRNILRFRAGYRLLPDEQKPIVIEVYYYPASPLSHLLVHPSPYLYNTTQLLNEPQLNLGNYSYEDINQLIIETLESENIDLSDLKTKRAFALDQLDWKNQYQLEFELVQKCWEIAKSQTKSSIKAFYVAGDSSGCPRDLDNGQVIHEIGNPNAMIDYLKQQNIL